MPVEPIIIDTTIESVGALVNTYGNILLIGEDEAGSALVNVVGEYTTLTDIATDFGVSSKVYQAAEMIFNQGVPKVWAVKIDVTSVAAESITAGSAQSFANSPVKGGTVVCATYTVQYDYVDPPTDPGASKAEVGTEGSEIFLNGAGAKNVDYDYYDVAALEAAIQDYEDDISLVYFCGFTDGSGNGGASAQDWGILSQIVDWADSFLWVTVIPGRGDETATQQLDDLTAGGLTSYESRGAVMVAHLDSSSDDDVGAAVIGKMSTIVPWDKLMWKAVAELDDDNITSFTKTQITTFETNKVNALFTRQSAWRPSDGLTGAGGDYKFVDITRTRYYMEDAFKLGLGDLIQNTTLPYTQTGINTVKQVIENICERAVLDGALREPFINGVGVLTQGFTVEVPNINDVSQADRDDRILRNVFVTLLLRGHIQEIRLNMAIQL